MVVHDGARVDAENYPGPVMGATDKVVLKTGRAWIEVKHVGPGKFRVRTSDSAAIVDLEASNAFAIQVYSR